MQPVKVCSPKPSGALFSGSVALQKPAPGLSFVMSAPEELQPSLKKARVLGEGRKEGGQEGSNSHKI